MPTLTWNFDIGGTEAVKPNVASAKFGDGYEANASVGLNPLSRKWSLTSTRPESVNQTLVSFLEARKGAETFDWTNARGETGKYICRNWDVARPMFGLTAVTCEFERVYA